MKAVYAALIIGTTLCFGAQASGHDSDDQGVVGQDGICLMGGLSFSEQLNCALGIQAEARKGIQAEARKGIQAEARKGIQAEARKGIQQENRRGMSPERFGKGKQN